MNGIKWTDTKIQEELNMIKGNKLAEENFNVLNHKRLRSPGNAEEVNKQVKITPNSTDPYASKTDEVSVIKANRVPSTKPVSTITTFFNPICGKQVSQ